MWIKFNAHLDALFDAVRSLRFDVFELNLRMFWALEEEEKEVCQAPSLAGIMSRAEAIVFDVSPFLFSSRRSFWEEQIDFASR